mgnify:CR=1 FL=1
MARKSRKQTAAPMPAPSLYVHVALYIRLSVEDNGKKDADSLDNQRELLLSYVADRPYLELIEIYEDNGWTGTDFDRPAFQRMLEDGYMTVKVQTPCLITCIKELNEPRYMSVGGVYESFKKPIAVFDFNTLKDDPLIDLTTIGLKGSPTNIFKSFTPPPKGVGQMLEGADKATCESLAETLAAKHII